MRFFKILADFFASLFGRAPGDRRQREQRKKLEADLRSFQPRLYKKGNLLPAFAEAVRALYVDAKPLDNLFLDTIGGSDIPKRMRFEAQLVLTGFTPDEQAEIESLKYENRKKRVVNLQSSPDSATRDFELQRRALDKILARLQDESFKAIDKELAALHQLADLCRFNFVGVIQNFDANFNSADLSYRPAFQEAALSGMGNSLEDLYFQIAGLQINAAVAQAVLALAQLKSAAPLSKETTELYMKSVKRIAYVITRVLTPDHLLALVRVNREDAAYVPKTAEYNESACGNFAQRLQKQFSADEQRIKAELKDMQLGSALSNLFGGKPLSALSGCNENLNAKLQANSALSFAWITPLQILKTFLEQYLSEPVTALFENIVIEGFFTEATYKTEFSNIVYAASECSPNLQKFENYFRRGEKYDTAVLDGYMRDSHSDTDFYAKLEGTVQAMNKEAQKLVQDEVNALHELYVRVSELLADAKKPSGDIISNLHILMSSSRNRDGANLLERQISNWEIFFDIMKNYTIINVGN